MIPLGNPEGDFKSPLPAVVAPDAGALSVITREQSEIQSAIISAKKFPRDEFQAVERIKRSFSRASMAEAAEYSFKRGKNPVTGPTAPAAREMARCWGNMRSGTRLISIDEQYVHLKGFALDLESNTYFECEDRFKKLIQKKLGKTTKWIEPDERELRELQNRRGAILERNCILELIPPDVVEIAIETARLTLRKGAQHNLEKNREAITKDLLSAFAALGVTLEMLEKNIGRSITLLNQEEYVELRSVYKAIRAGNAKPEEFFDSSSNTGSAQVRDDNAGNGGYDPETGEVLS